MTENNVELIIAIIAILFPIYMIFVSMACYVGKVWAIRILFRRNDKNGEEKKQKKV
jgi:hypothetical protein